MDVDVHDRLMGGGTVVLEKVVVGGARRLAHRPADSGQHSAKGRGRVVREFGHGRLGLLRDHERMASAEWGHIQECEDVVVLEDAVAGDLALDDA